jgi:hypothetical protein
LPPSPGPAPAPAWRSGQGRAEDAALPPAPRRRPTHPRTAPTLAAHSTPLALGPRPGTALARLTTLPVPPS